MSSLAVVPPTKRVVDFTVDSAATNFDIAYLTPRVMCDSDEPPHGNSPWRYFPHRQPSPYSFSFFVEPQPLQSISVVPTSSTFLDRLPEALRLQLYMYATSSLYVPNPCYGIFSLYGPRVPITVQPCKVCLWNALYPTQCILHTQCTMMYRYGY